MMDIILKWYDMALNPRMLPWGQYDPRLDTQVNIPYVTEIFVKQVQCKFSMTFGPANFILDILKRWTASSILGEKKKFFIVSPRFLSIFDNLLKNRFFQKRIRKNTNILVENIFFRIYWKLSFSSITNILEPCKVAWGQTWHGVNMTPWEHARYNFSWEDARVKAEHT